MKFKNKFRPPKKMKRAPPTTKTGQRFKDFNDRKSARGAELGRATEDRVFLLLRKKYEQGEISWFAQHPANSPEDHAGKDFTVKMLIDGREITASFGITISKNKTEHNIPIIIIPPEMTDERIWYRICRICKEEAKQ